MQVCCDGIAKSRMKLNVVLVMGIFGAFQDNNDGDSANYKLYMYDDISVPVNSCVFSSDSLRIYIEVRCIRHPRNPLGKCSFHTHTHTYTLTYTHTHTHIHTHTQCFSATR